MAADRNDAEAAEAALGLVPPKPETPAQAELREEWERRLAPLARIVRPAEPPADMPARIAAAIGADEARREAALETARERSRARRWRAGALGATALAAGLAALILVPDLGGRLGLPGPAPVLETAERYVAVVTADGGGPALLVEFDIGRGTATLRPVGVTAEAGRSLELWRVPGGGGAPNSLGLLDPGRPALLEASAAPGDVIAVSVEPAGGSPTGGPTGPVVLSGPVVAAE